MDFKLNKSNLNFRVYTASALPSTAQENDICVISDVPMKNWILSPDAPSGAPRTDGDVWIRYSVTGTTFNALKTDVMMVATISASQYVNGAWVDVKANNYQNGEWVDWVTYLYKDGEFFEDLTGSLETLYKSNGTPTVTYNKDNINFVDNNATGTYAFANKIDLSGKSKLFCECKAAGTGNYSCQFIILSSKTVTSSSWDLVKAIEAIKDNTIHVIEIDVSSIDSGYIGFYCTVGNTSADYNFTVYKVWTK